jgi:hypothetical protein
MYTCTTMAVPGLTAQEESDDHRPGSRERPAAHRAARDRGVSRSEFIRQQIALVLEQYRPHAKPESAGVILRLAERGDERELFGGRE